MRQEKKREINVERKGKKTEIITTIVHEMDEDDLKTERQSRERRIQQLDDQITSLTVQRESEKEALNTLNIIIGQMAAEK